MTKNEVMKIARQYAKQHYSNCDIVWYAGEQFGCHFFWLKDSSAARYSGLGVAIAISNANEVFNITDGTEINEIRKKAVDLQNGN